MTTTERLHAQLPHTLRSTDFPALGEKYQGKVRDVYRHGDRLVLITTDRLSAFDHVLTTLPFKGDLLNQLAHFWFQKTAHVAKNHVIDKPDPCVTVAKRAEPYAIEFVVRAYLTGSLWRDYEKGADPYALKLPPGLKKDSKFEKPILTPSTKAPVGTHDEPLSVADVVKRGTMTQKQWDEASAVALALFAEGQKQAAARGLIFVDTKYELGNVKGELHVIDEMHTPDSSRYWVASEYAARFAAGEPQKMLDKENLRQWLINERGFSGHGALPSIPDDVRVGLTEKYLAAYEQITGTSFALEVGDVRGRLEKNLRAAKLL
ncbi:MAG: phosphoribosylaminoimidazolesuccinocarboxamide synthase [Myxococcaceae bacterium]|nr:phosphoribosylaminoimidazolesuccinocarboxamide synthase [Myxococcaceae bacterium]